MEKRFNFFKLEKEEYIKINSIKINELKNILGSDKITIIKGLRNFGKQNFIKNFIKSNNLKSYFYFDKLDDINNSVITNTDLDELLNQYIRLYKKPSIVILNNIYNIKNINQVINKLFNDDIQIILMGNNIKIEGVKEFMIGSIYENISYDEIFNINKYGNNTLLEDYKLITKKQNILKLLSSDIIYNDIVNGFSLKNSTLYNFTITKIAYSNTYQTYTDIHILVNTILNGSLKTITDYIEYSIQAKIIKKAYKFDLKNNTPINGKAKYYFSDNGIRNSLTNFELDSNILLENLIFNILDYNNYTIYGGLNNSYNFTFFCQNNKQDIAIHLFFDNSRDKLKYHINKLSKLDTNIKKIILVKNTNELGIRKVDYENVQILEINEFIVNFTKNSY